MRTGCWSWIIFQIPKNLFELAYSIEGKINKIIYHKLGVSKYGIINTDITHPLNSHITLNQFINHAVWLDSHKMRTKPKVSQLYCS